MGLSQIQQKYTNWYIFVIFHNSTWIASKTLGYKRRRIMD